MVHWGPQPYEAYLSEVCEAFGCLPDEAERQDQALVRAILDYRNAKHAIELFNQGDRGAQALQKHPQLLALLVEMHRAQGGTADKVEDVLVNVTEAEADGD